MGLKVSLVLAPVLDDHHEMGGTDDDPARRAAVTRHGRAGLPPPGLAAVMIILGVLILAGQPSAAQDASSIPTPASSAGAIAPEVPEGLAMWSPVGLAEIPFDYSCGGMRFKASAIADGLPIEEASPPILSTARSGGLSTDGRTWRVIADDGERVTVASVIDGRARTESPIYTVELVRSPTGWEWEREGPCSPGARFDTGLGGYWRLDPGREPPSRDSRRLHLKVWHMGCTTGIRLRGQPQVTMTDEAVLIAVPVEPTSRSTRCRPGPPTRVGVRLPEPLGDRALYDAAKLPVRLVQSALGPQG
jgi:hypothetical protein